ncbi:hypothetical protein HBH69_127310 [Parastagonospora nodorum]|nr:hypothetical protein HBH69_127310 [Parastagonospora nodorum]KAH5746532.1 hypothetical protein HBI18_006320 [Parastagonospora nodorum]
MDLLGPLTDALQHQNEEVTLRNQLESPLLRLPAEIRNNIYENVLGGHEFRRNVYIVDIFSLSKQIDLGKHRRLLAITATCRQLQNETQKLVFRLNSVAGECIDVRVCLRKKGLRRKPLAFGVGARDIHTLRIFIDACATVGDRVSLIELVKKVPNLKQVVVVWDERNGPSQDRVRESAIFLEKFEKTLVKLGRASLRIDIEFKSEGMIDAFYIRWHLRR